MIPTQFNDDCIITRTQEEFQRLCQLAEENGIEYFTTTGFDVDSACNLRYYFLEKINRGEIELLDSRAEKVSMTDTMWENFIETYQSYVQELDSGVLDSAFKDFLRYHNLSHIEHNIEEDFEQNVDTNFEL